MLFNSYTFVLLFLPIVVAGYQVLGMLGARRAVIGWLVLSSLFYYGWWDPKYLLLIVGSMVVNYFAGRMIGGRGSRPVRWGALVCGVAVNLVVLAYYKYTNFFLDVVGDVTGVRWDVGTIVLPLAISFFTFQQVAYLVDAWRGQAREYNFTDYCLFVTFFPQLIAGPIVHHGEMLPQFSEKKHFTLVAEDMAVGTAIFTMGLFKKVMIADPVAAWATPVFNDALLGGTPTFFEAWVGVLGYTFQIYFDFSGYSDMAIGIARMFGIILPLNFNSPYKATNISDFWRRWHMTLSRFLRDYLYIPLGGNRSGPRRRYMNLALTMLLGGLWHGANWTFVFWGALHGLFLCIHHAWRAWRTRVLGWQDKDLGPAYLAFSLVLTQAGVVLAWVFFRAGSFEAATTMLSSMAGLNGFDLSWTANESRLVAGCSLAALVFFVWLAPNTQELMRHYRPALDFSMRTTGRNPLDRLAWHPTALWGILLAAMAIISILSMSRVSEFIYYQF
jgi:alginate O-acetyltransferase complex protein AlgI